jgi:hypothetical protein
MRFRIRRGPETEETKGFEITPADRETELDVAFQRDCTFDKDRNGVWLTKEMTIHLQYMEMGSWHSTGTMTIDLAPLIGQGEVTVWFNFTDQICTESARIECTFHIISGEEKENASLRVRRMLDSLQDEKMMAYIAEDERETAAKIEEMTKIIS